jgi:hypothetical protein
LLDAQDLAHTDTASAWLDTNQCDGSVLSVNVGALTGVDGSNYLTPVLQESDTTVATDATTVAAGDVQGAFTKMDANTEDQVTQFVGYIGSKRYVRVNLDYTGTGITASLVSVDGILGMAKYPPSPTVAAVAAT